MKFETIVARLVVFFLVSAAMACETDYEQNPQGACGVRLDYFDSEPDGPYNCHDDWFETMCNEYDDVFHPHSTCAELGYNFCCETDILQYRFKTFSDAQWYDMLYNPRGTALNCADNPITCLEPQNDDNDNNGDNTDECSRDSQCGSREECRSGRCVRVECTTDSHCGSCERCSDNVCRDCGEGPYGCYC